jgi:hypothetical protein
VPDGATAATRSGLRIQARKNGRMSAAGISAIPFRRNADGLKAVFRSQGH